MTGASDPHAPPVSGSSQAAGKSKDVAHAARSGAVQVLTIAAQAVLTVSHVLLARLFGLAVFGSYQASLAILEMVTRAGTAGADKGMLRYVAGHRARGEPELVRSALGTGLRLCLLVSGSLVLLTILLAEQLGRLSHAPTVAVALRWMAPAALFTGCMWVLIQASLATKVTRANFLVRGLGEPMFLLVAGITAALFGRSLVYLAVAHAAAAAATLFLAVVVVGRLFGAGELLRSLRSPWLPGFTRFSLPLGFAELMNAVLQRADIVLLTIFVGTNAAAVYAAAEFITRIISNARYVFDSVAAPVFSEALHLGQRDRLRQNLVLMTRWVATAAAPIAVTVLVLRRDLLALYGSGFQEGATALAVLAIGHLVNSTFGLAGWVLVVSGRSRLVLLNNVAAALLNVALGLTLIPRWGLVGTALASLCSVSLMHVMVATEVRILHGVHVFRWAVLKPFLAATAALAVELFIFRHIDRTALRVPLVIMTGLVTYLLGLRGLGLDPDDRRLLDGLKTRLRRWRGRSNP